MQLLDYINAALLGLVEGLTEFLPVSSTGHLILASDLLGFKAPPGHMFEISIQLGAILAICWLYRVKLTSTAFGMFKRGPDQRFAGHILCGFLPAMVLGLALHDLITKLLFSPYVVCTTLILGGFAILLIERKKPLPVTHSLDAFTWQTSLKIGFCQALAMVPGVSRSGATIMGAMLLKIERRTATEFSFFLAIPTMLAATSYSLYQNRDALSDAGNVGLITLGFLAAFLTAMLVVKTAVNFIAKHGFVPFAWYRIGLGSLMLALLTLS